MDGDITVPRQISSIDSSTTVDDFLPCFLVGVEVFNFKSYHEIHRVGPFTNITAIFGPNGSGKSNLMDAISFALIIKSDKLRAKNIGKLINNNSNQNDFENLESKNSKLIAYAKLNFASRRDPGMTITFQRSVILSGGDTFTSIYHINDLSVEKYEYRSYLERLGFGTKDKNFLIFQNTIDKVITKNPRDFTMLIEELSGSYAFKNEYDELKLKCDQISIKLVSLSKKRQAIFKSKKFVENLEEQYNKSSQVLKDLELNQIKLILLELYNIQMQIDKSRHDMEDCSTTIQDYSIRIDLYKQEKVELIENLAHAQQEVIRLENIIREIELEKLFKLRMESESAREEVLRIENRVKNSRSNRDKLMIEQNINREIIENLQREIDKLETEISYVQDKINQKQTELDPEMIEEYKRLKEKYQVERISIDQKYHELDVLNKNLIDRKNLVLLQKQEFEIDQNQPDDTEELSEKIKKFKKELGKLSQEKRELMNKLKEIRNQHREIEEELKQYTKILIEQNMKMKKIQQNEKDGQFVRYLMKNYHGVYGRLNELCAPINHRYKIAIYTVMKRHFNAIVVDSFRTVQEILKNEKTMAQTESFLPLDMIRSPEIKEHLRNIVDSPDVHLIYDLIEKKKPCAEKAIRFVVGNTLLASTKEVAAKMAFDLGDGNRYNCVCLDGTFFQGNGIISDNLTTKNLDISWNSSDEEIDHDEYERRLQHKENLQKSLAELVGREDGIISRLNEIETEIVRVTVEMESLMKLKKRQTEQLEKRKQIQMKLDLLEKQEQEIKAELERHAEEFEEYQRELARAEQMIFGQFLSRWNLNSIKQLEEIYFDSVDDDQKQLNDCQNRLDGLRIKLKLEEHKTEKIERGLEKWTSVLEEEKNKLTEARKLWEEKYQLQLKEVETEMENLRERLKHWRTTARKLETELQKIDDEMERLKNELNWAKKNVVELKSKIEHIFLAKRHELLARAYFEGISLPFITGDIDQQRQIFTNASNMSLKEIFKEEENLVIDFDQFPDIKKFSDQHEYEKLKFNLETDLDRLEKELEIATISDDSIPAKKKELVDNMQLINQQLRETRKEYVEIRKKFEECKRQRLDLFNSFFQPVSNNLDILYKELMQDQASQSFLIPENSDEPYLGGIIYNCIVPGKIFQPVTCLSGGEKTLAGFIFIFASYIKPFPPFFIMDEIDGALDNKNILKLMRFLKSKTDYTQFILISLKPELHSQCDSLIGVCRKKEQNAIKSQTFSLDLRKYN